MSKLNEQPKRVYRRVIRLSRSKSELTEQQIAELRLAAAGLLVTNLPSLEKVIPITDDELDALGIMRAGARPSEDLIREDRDGR